jgi:hypothetical protein
LRIYGWTSVVVGEGAVVVGVVGAVVDDGAVEGVDVGAGVPPTTVGGRVVVVVEVASAIVVPAAI